MKIFYLNIKLAVVLSVFSPWVIPCFGQPQNFPKITFVILDSASTVGYFFMSPYSSSLSNQYQRPQIILDRFGRIVYYRTFNDGPDLTANIDFKLQPDGRMSYFDTNKGKFFLMDSTFTDVDSIACVNGFMTDEHDMQILPDHHYLLFGGEIRIMNLTAYHWFGINHTLPGSAHAQVTGVVVQEFDQDKNLVFEWKGHDHYQFSDVDPVWLFNPNKVDWTHANAVERDNDGNILLSLRHFNEITKIDHNTGDIIWRLGGKQNQFTFPNDPVGFTGQHDIRRVSDTSISMFDNGQYTNPPVARALEYALDENNKIANLVWAYIYDSSMVSAACGNHQYIANANHLVDFGFVDTIFPWMTVVRPDQSKILEAYMPSGYISYRSFNYPSLPWELHRPNVECEKIGNSYFLVAEAGHPEYLWSTGEVTQSIQIAKTGEYWVIVPYGAGHICSEYIYVNDLNNPCLYTDVQEQVVPQEISLSCMPNPASDKVKVMFDLPSNSSVIISLNNLLGTEIEEPVHGYYLTGKHEVTMDVSNLKKEVYILSMTSNGTRIVKKLIIQ